MNKHDSPNEFEAALTKQLRASTDEFSDETLAKLRHARAQALQPRFATRPTIYAIAASVMVAVGSIWVLQQPVPVDVDVAYWEIDPELLDTMDMLAVFGELDAI